MAGEAPPGFIFSFFLSLRGCCQDRPLRKIYHCCILQTFEISYIKHCSIHTLCRTDMFGPDILSKGIDDECMSVWKNIDANWRSVHIYICISADSEHADRSGTSRKSQVTSVCLEVAWAAGISIPNKVIQENYWYLVNAWCFSAFFEAKKCRPFIHVYLGGLVHQNRGSLLVELKIKLHSFPDDGETWSM